jgi:hypothetical protein
VSELINGWSYSRDPSGVVNAVDPNGFTHTFRNWNAFWNAAGPRRRKSHKLRNMAIVVGAGIAGVDACSLTLPEPTPEEKAALNCSSLHDVTIFTAQELRSKYQDKCG